MNYKRKIGITYFVVMLLMVVLFQACSSASYNKGDNRLTKIETSPQYDQEKFRNKQAWKTPSFFSFFGTAWDFLFMSNQRTPEDSLPSQMVDLTFFNASAGNHLNVTWLGHSSLMINMDGIKILTDPVFENRVSFFGPSRYNGELPLNPEMLPEIDVVLISHNHYDHLNRFSIELLKDRTSKFIVPLAVGATLDDWGVPPEKIIELDWWDEINLIPDLMIAATPAQHFSGRGLMDRDETLWMSFVLKSVNHKIFYGGDSGYFDGFKRIGDSYGPFDMTFLECGAYNEKWHHIHMFPEETVQAHIDLKGKILHPIHWGTFNLSLHAWFEPMQRFTKAADSLGIRTATPIVGGTTVYENDVPGTRWWENLISKKD